MSLVCNRDPTRKIHKCVSNTCFLDPFVLVLCVRKSEVRQNGLDWHDAGISAGVCNGARTVPGTVRLPWLHDWCHCPGLCLFGVCVMTHPYIRYAYRDLMTHGIIQVCVFYTNKSMSYVTHTKESYEWGCLLWLHDSCHYTGLCLFRVCVMTHSYIWYAYRDLTTHDSCPGLRLLY